MRMPRIHWERPFRNPSAGALMGVLYGFVISYITLTNIYLQSGKIAFIENPLETFSGMVNITAVFGLVGYLLGMFNAIRQPNQQAAPIVDKLILFIFASALLAEKNEYLFDNTSSPELGKSTFTACLFGIKQKPSPSNALNVFETLSSYFNKN